MNNVYNNTSVENTAETKFPQNYQLNEEEQKIMAQCRAEGNTKGALFATLAGGLTYRSIKSYNLAVSQKYGTFPKVGAACLFGFFAGKMLAIPSCYKKFKDHPNSPLGAYIRRQQEGYSVSLPAQSAPDLSLNFSTVDPLNGTGSNQMNSALDMDIYNSPSDMDSYVGNELNSSKSVIPNDNLPDQNHVHKPGISYAELRERNREAYLKDKEKYDLASPIINEAPTGHPVKQSPLPIPIDKRNKYGDVWE